LTSSCSGRLCADDWRVNDRLTLNYGLGLEQNGLREKDNQITVNFDQTVVNPLNNSANVIDHTGARRTIMGGLVFAGRTAHRQSRGTSRDQGGSARRRSPHGRPCCAAALLLALGLPSAARTVEPCGLGDDRRAAVDQASDRLDEQPFPTAS
jgi:hypothetical protein